MENIIYKKRIEHYNRKCFEIAKNIQLFQKTKDATVSINIESTNELIYFKNIEKMVPKYFSFNECGDDLVFEIIKDNSIIIHVFEHKKSLSSKNRIFKVKNQCYYLMIIGISIAATLNLKIDEIKMYCGCESNNFDKNPHLTKELINRRTELVREKSENKKCESKEELEIKAAIDYMVSKRFIYEDGTEFPVTQINLEKETGLAFMKDFVQTKVN